MLLKHKLAMGVAAAALLVAAGPSYADDSGQMEQLQSQIHQLQTQLQLLQSQVNQVQAQAPASAAPANAPKVTESASHRFGLSSADGQNTIELTGRLHLDAGDYFGYKPQTGTTDRMLASGVNARRARIGVTGKFQGDFVYGLIYDFGGSSDSLNDNNLFANGNSTKGQGAATVSQSAISGVENAFITYNGLYTGRAVPVAFDLGVIDVPWTLDEATSSNDIMFIERSSSQVVATAFGGGDFRTAAGVRSNNDRYFVAAYVTGPQTGALHDNGIGNSATVNSNGGTGHMVQLSSLFRGSYQILQSDDYSLHVGANYAHLFQPRGSSNAQTISLSDRPELRVDPSVFLNTGNINATSGNVYGLEFAGAVQNFFLQSEYYHYEVNQLGMPPAAGYLATPAPSLNFNGGYIEASYSFGGKRKYNPATGAYTGVIPTNPLSLSSGTFGAIEIAARYSRVNLNDHVVNGLPLASTKTGAGSVFGTGGVDGGDQAAYGIGINYYPNPNVKFMLDYEHVDLQQVSISNTKGPTVGVQTGTGMNVNFIALRTQINF